MSRCCATPQLPGAAPGTATAGSISPSARLASLESMKTAGNHKSSGKPATCSTCRRFPTAAGSCSRFSKPTARRSVRTRRRSRCFPRTARRSHRFSTVATTHGICPAATLCSCAAAGCSPCHSTSSGWRRRLPRSACNRMCGPIQSGRRHGMTSLPTGHWFTFPQVISHEPYRPGSI